MQPIPHPSGEPDTSEESSGRSRTRGTFVAQVAGGVLAGLLVALIGRAGPPFWLAMPLAPIAGGALAARLAGAVPNSGWIGMRAGLYGVVFPFAAGIAGAGLLAPWPDSADWKYAGLISARSIIPASLAVVLAAIAGWSGATLVERLSRRAARP